MVTSMVDLLFQLNAHLNPYDFPVTVKVAEQPFPLVPAGISIRIFLNGGFALNTKLASKSSEYKAVTFVPKKSLGVKLPFEPLYPK